MIHRWVLCPVTAEAPVPGWPHVRRFPKVADIGDPGRPNLGAFYDDMTPVGPKTVNHRSVISDGVARAGDRDGIAICLISAVSLANVDLDASIRTLSFRDFATPDEAHDFLLRTPRQEGWLQTRLNNVKRILRDEGGDDADITLDLDLDAILMRFARRIHAGHTGLKGLIRPRISSGTTLVFHDDCVVGADVNLQARTPSPVGLSYTREAESTSSLNLRILNANDQIDSSGGAVSVRAMYTFNPNPALTSAEADIGGQLNVNSASADDPWILTARSVAGAGALRDLYGAVMYPPGAAADVKIYKRVTDVVTELDTGDTGPAANDVFLFQVRNVAKTLLKNGADIGMATTDNVITAIGVWGLTYGNLFVDMDDIGTNVPRLDEVKLTDQTPSPIPPLPHKPRLNPLLIG